MRGRALRAVRHANAVNGPSDKTKLMFQFGAATAGTGQTRALAARARVRPLNVNVSDRHCVLPGPWTFTLAICLRARDSRD